VVGDFVGRVLVQYLGAGDNLEPVGATIGKLGSKKGDFVWTLGPDSGSPGARIAIEAKADKSYTLRKAWEEIAKAREARESEFGVFVFSKAHAPTGAGPLTRSGSNLMVVWDHQDGTTDLAFTVALSVACALVTRQKLEAEQAPIDFSEIYEAIKRIQKATVSFTEITRCAGLIGKHADTISEAAEDAQAEV
jgi:hypothetical protein